MTRLRSNVQTISKSFRAGVAEIVTIFLCQWSVNVVAFYMCHANIVSLP
jgi:hypothetical protein